MYRQRFPDAPNMFSDVRRPYRPPLSVLFKRTWLTSILGILVVLVGVFIMFDNERRAVHTTHALEEGHRNILVPETTSVVFEENNGKLVLVSGELTIEDNLSDTTYGISIPAVKLKKWVQMYQWYETADTADKPGAVHEGDHDSHTETTYSYARDWFDKRIDSEAFHNTMGHHNPESWPVNSSLAINQRVKIGNYFLGKELKQKFTSFTPFTSDERPANPQIKMHAGLYFHARNVWESDVGDIRVQFSYAGKHGDQVWVAFPLNPQIAATFNCFFQVTVVGRQSGREIRPYYSETGSKELLFLHQGLRSPQDVFQSEHAQNRIQTWAFRIGAWLGIFIGLNCISHLLEMIGEFQA